MDSQNHSQNSNKNMKHTNDIQLPSGIPFFPSMLQFGTQDFMSSLSFPSLNENAATLFDTNAKNISSFNLAQDTQNKDSIVKLLSTADPNTLNLIHKIKNSVDVSHILLNTVGLAAKKDDLEKMNNVTTLMSAYVAYEKENVGKENVAPDASEQITKKRNKTKARSKKVTASTNELDSKINARTEPIDQTLQKEEKEFAHPSKQYHFDNVLAAAKPSEQLAEAFSDFFTWSDHKSDKEIIPEDTFASIRREIQVAISNQYIKTASYDNISKLLHVLEEQLSDLGDEFAEELESKQIVIRSFLDCGNFALEIINGYNVTRESELVEILDLVLRHSRRIFKDYMVPIIEVEASESKKKKKLSAVESEQSSICSLLDKIYKLLLRLPMKSHHISSIYTLTLDTMFAEGVERIQLYSLKILSLIFSKYKEERTVILKEIIVCVLRLPNTKKVQKNYKMEDGTSIQTFTALILSLIQSCVVVKEEKETTPDVIPDSSQDFEEPKTNELFEVQLKESVACCKVFVELFLERCSEKTDDVNGFNIIKHFIEDILQVMYHPSWPCIFYLLQWFQAILYNNYIKGSASKTNKMKQISVEVLGDIATKFRKVVVEYEKESVSFDKNISAVDDLMNQYKSLALDYNDRMKLMVYIFLASNSSHSLIHVFAKQYYLCIWSTSEPSKALFFENLLKLSSSKFSTADISTSDALQASKILFMKQQEALNSLFSDIFKHIVEIAFDQESKDNTLVRKSAMQAIHNITDADVVLLQSADIQKLLEEKLRKEMPSVKEAVIQLLGSVLIKSKVIPATYIDSLIDATKDDKPSVRKASVGVLQKLCARENIPEALQNKILQALFSRLYIYNNEEDYIKKTIHAVMDKLWFEKQEGSKSDVYYRSALQILDLVYIDPVDFSDIGNYWFVLLLKSHLPDLYNTSIPQILKKLLDHTLSISKHPTEEPNPRNNAVYCSTVLYLIFYVFPSLSTNYMGTLFSCLGSSLLGDEYIEYILKILIVGIPTMSPLSHDALLQWINVLLKYISTERVRSQVIACAVECFCLFTEKTSTWDKMGTVIRQLMGAVKDQYNKGMYSHRGTFALSLFCRFAKWPILQQKYADTSVEYTKAKDLVLQVFKQHSHQNLSNCTQVLTHLLISDSTLFGNIQIVNFISKVSQSADVEAQINLSILFKEFLISYDKKIESAAKTSTENADQGVGSTALTGHLKDILHLMECESLIVRRNTIRIIEHCIRNGIFIPDTICKSCICYASDIDITVSEQALIIIKFLEEKHRSVLLNKAADGIIYSFKYLSKTKSSVVGYRISSKKEVNSRFSRVFELLKLKTAESTKLFGALMKELTANQDHSFVKYMCEVIAYFEMDEAQLSVVMSTLTAHNEYSDVEQQLSDLVSLEQPNLDTLYKDNFIQKCFCALYLLRLEQSLQIMYTIKTGEDSNQISKAIFRSQHKGYEVVKVSNFNVLLEQGKAAMVSPDSLKKSLVEFSKLFEEYKPANAPLVNAFGRQKSKKAPNGTTKTPKKAKATKTKKRSRKDIEEEDVEDESQWKSNSESEDEEMPDVHDDEQESEQSTSEEEDSEPSPQKLPPKRQKVEKASPPKSATKKVKKVEQKPALDEEQNTTPVKARSAAAKARRASKTNKQ